MLNQCLHNYQMTELFSQRQLPSIEYRRAVYDLVWRVPSAKIAEQFGVERHKFAEHCRTLGIPIPYRGYWGRKRAGRAAFRARLSYPNDHLLVAKTRVALSALIIDSRQIVCGPRATYLDLRVSKNSLLRALRIYNALLCRIEDLGGVPVITAGRTGWTTIQFGQKYVPVYLSERLQAIDYHDRNRTAWYKNQVRDFHPSVFVYDRWETYPTGKLTLHYGHRRWSDETGCRLERQLPEATEYMAQITQGRG